jgi:pimeloyl-ACP methyl ester carboxylesterase
VDVDPSWLFKALALTLLAAFVCGYLTLCLLFYQGQWQLVLHPKRTTSSQAPVLGAELVHFAPGESGNTELSGLWIPATEGHYAQSQQTILLLRSGDGSVSDDTTILAAIHGLGLNVFAFDYRGYGQSAATHPTQARMTEDANSAWQYLRTLRNLSDQQIIPYGIGVGAALATNLAATHAQIHALILQNPIPDVLGTIQSDPRTKLVPLRLLFNERFELAAPLATLNTPKLFLLTDNSAQSLANSAASPKTSATLHPIDLYSPIYLDQLSRFLDEYPAKH